MMTSESNLRGYHMVEVRAKFDFIAEDGGDALVDGVSSGTGEAVEVEPTTALGRRGRRTREALVRAARLVFERDGFVKARIADISAEADYGHGTFYTYFRSKEEIFKEVVLQIQDGLAGPPPVAPPGDDPYSQIEYANRQYVTAYKANARLMATLEQAATVNPEIRQLQLDIRTRFVRRNTRAIQRWQVEGIADPTVDAAYAAHFLGSMVEGSVYTWLVLGEPFEEERTIQMLTKLWGQGLGIEPGRPRSRRGKSRSQPIS